ncbi:uncharacterized protein F4812DRAFT_455038 [Daldinia caldariorum]|uniref:uncharacterized protein n=1 Tax=Daldinia caldariorum TaxID=326644 RepID=UPI0020089D44|nr:uncharacterized protein F4812DRAFT_455038 [Daldinia caldariorum]KAI1473223.1 hypothetical protein F4812DRAFT_455038 [Daldinia caldariorum]
MVSIYEFITRLHDLVSNPTPRPGLHPIPGSQPLTFGAAVTPPLIYYVALLLLAPPPPPAVDSIYVNTIRNILALVSAVLFFRLPLAYHVPQSIGLTYQLGLVGLYGGCRVVDAFFISPYFFKHIPRRVKYVHKLSVVTDAPEESAVVKAWSDGGVEQPNSHREKATTAGEETSAGSKSAQVEAVSNADSAQASRRTRSSFHIGISDAARRMSNSIPGAACDSYYHAVRRTLHGPGPQAVLETATTESGWPQSLRDRASWALELALSMRGAGFTWTTADVRHTRRTWLPTVGNRAHSILARTAPVLLASWCVVRGVYLRYLGACGDLAGSRGEEEGGRPRELFDEALPLPVQVLLTGALGAFLMTAFSLGHSLFAIALSPLAPSPLAFFPPLYSTRIWDVTSVRGFWSYGWHRLFARLFLVYGVWPGEWVERKLLGKRDDEPADVGKVLGGFLCSAFVHSFSVRGVLGGDWNSAAGEAKFFALNGFAVVVEGAVSRAVRRARKERGFKGEAMWYDGLIGRVWWLAVLLGSGRNFARGWVKSGLVREIAGQ